MNDKDYFHTMVSVFLVLMSLAMAAAVDWQLHDAAHAQLMAAGFTT